VTIGLTPWQKPLVRRRVLGIGSQGTGDVAGVSETAKDVDHTVGISAVVPELCIVGTFQKAVGVIVEIADQFQKLGQDGCGTHGDELLIWQLGARLAKTRRLARPAPPFQRASLLLLVYSLAPDLAHRQRRRHQDSARTGRKPAPVDRI